MTLYDYIQSFPKGQRMVARQKLAHFLGITDMAIRHWENGRKKISAEHVLKIEKFTEKKVKRYELRPDLYPEEEYEKLFK